MKAMLLAAGRGTRLGSLTRNTPKPMMPIAGKPLLEYVISLMKKYLIEDIIINLHHCPEAVVNYFGDGRNWGVHISYSLEDQLLGTAGAIKKVESSLSETFLVYYADNLSNCDIARLIEFHFAHKGIGTVALAASQAEITGGIAKFDEKSRITRFLEKPGKDQLFSDLVNAGIYVLEPAIFDYIPPNRYYDFGTDLFPGLLERQVGLYGYLMSDFLLPIDTPEKYRSTQLEVAERGLC